MSDIQPTDPSLLTDDDVDTASFTCCDDRGMVFLRCPACAHIWVECFECDTWHVGQGNLDESVEIEPDAEQRVSCPGCEATFADATYLADGNVDKYLPTAEQVIAAGLGKYLSHQLRYKYRIGS